MQTTLKITEADRDSQGKIKVAADEPRSLADLLPSPEAIRKDAKRPRTELATLAAVGLVAAFVVVYAWATPSAPPVARPTAIATIVPTTAPTPTVAPTAAPAALVGYFDYTNPASAAPFTVNQIRRVVGTAGDDWRLVDIGSARVWIAADQVPAGIPAADPLPDLAPRPTAAPQPAYVPPPPAPTRCASVGIPGKMAQACGTDDLAALQEQAQAQWTAQYGAQYAKP